MGIAPHKRARAGGTSSLRGAPGVWRLLHDRTALALRRWLALGLQSGRVRPDVERLDLMKDDEAVNLVLRRQPPTGALDELDAALRELDASLQTCLRHPADDDPVAQRLAELLTELDCDWPSVSALCFVLAPVLDSDLGRLYRLACNSVVPTLELLVRLGDPGGEVDACAQAMLLDQHPLQRSGLWSIDAARARPTPLAAQVSLHPGLAPYLLGLDARVPLPVGVSLVVAPARLDELCVEPSTLQRVRGSLRHHRGDGRAVALIGEERLEVKDLAQALAAQTGTTSVEIDAPLLVADGDRTRACREAFFLARLHRASVIVHGVEHLCAAGGGVAQAELARVLEECIRHAPTPTFLTSAQAPDILTGPLEGCVPVQVDPPSLATRVGFWERIMADVPLADVDHTALLTAFPLMPTEARRLRVAFLQEVAGRGRRWAIDDRTAMELARSVIRDDFEGLARRVTLGFVWDDLRLPPAEVDKLRQISSFAQHRGRATELLGKQFKLAHGQAVSALFKGPPGTGKTMAASVLAREMEAELYQVDLSQVVSKYIGETEKNLARLFEEARRRGAVLLFDEADSLFARRTKVSSSNDRHANAVVNFLLQQLEAFEGVLLMTTNNAAAIDPAFMRRIRFHVAFPAPDAEARLALWRALVPPALFAAHAEDFAALAEGYELSGGHIKNALLLAAAMAVADGSGITMAHVRSACLTELRQQGHLVRDEVEDAE